MLVRLLMYPWSLPLYEIQGHWTSFLRDYGNNLTNNEGKHLLNNFLNFWLEFPISWLSRAMSSTISLCCQTSRLYISHRLATRISQLDIYLTLYIKHDSNTQRKSQATILNNCIHMMECRSYETTSKQGKFCFCLFWKNLHLATK